MQQRQDRQGVLLRIKQHAPYLVDPLGNVSNLEHRIFQPQQLNRAQPLPQSVQQQRLFHLFYPHRYWQYLPRVDILLAFRQQE